MTKWESNPIEEELKCRRHPFISISIIYLFIIICICNVKGRGECGVKIIISKSLNITLLIIVTIIIKNKEYATQVYKLLTNLLLMAVTIFSLKQTAIAKGIKFVSIRSRKDAITNVCKIKFKNPKKLWPFEN